MAIESFIEISKVELEAIKYKDIENLDDNKCIKKLNITKKEFHKTLITARKKCATAALENKLIKIKEDEDEIQEDLPTTLCTFRCATCGRIYRIDYEKETIACPNCKSKKVMSNEEAGFYK